MTYIGASSEADAERAVRFKSIQIFLKMMRQPDVVAIDQGDVFAVDACNAAVARGRRTTVGLLNEFYAGIGVLIGANNIDCSVR